MRISDWSSDVCSSDLIGEIDGASLSRVADARRVLRRRAAVRDPRGVPGIDRIGRRREESQSTPVAAGGGFAVDQMGDDPPAASVHSSAGRSEGKGGGMNGRCWRPATDKKRNKKTDSFTTSNIV